MSDLGLSGSNDWGVHAPGTSEACAEGALTAFRDWGGFAASPHPACEEGEQSGADDWGDYAPVALPDLGEDAITGTADWGKYAPIALPDFGEGAFTGWDDWGEYAAQEGTTLAASDLELAARQNWVLSRYLAGKLWELDDFERPNLGWIGNAPGGGSYGLDGAVSVIGDQSCQLTSGGAAGAYASISKYIVRPPVPVQGFGMMFISSGTNVKVRLTVQAGYDSAEQQGGILWNLNTGEVDYFNPIGGWTQIGTVKAMPTGLNSVQFLQAVVDWENAKTVRFRVNHELVPVDKPHYGPFNWSASERIVPYIRVEAIDAVAYTLYVDAFVYTYDEPVAT